MPSTSYQYNKPSETYTIDQFIACQSDTEMNYNNLSFIDTISYEFMNQKINYSTYNAISDYLEEIRDEYCLSVTLTDKDLIKYIYRPKLLCHAVYGNGELAFIILLINDMYSVKQFTKTTLLLPSKANMSQICKYLFNANTQAIKNYNKNNSINN